MGFQHFNSKGPHLLLWAGLQAAHHKLAESGIPNHQHYCVIFIVCTQFTNVATG